MEFFVSGILTVAISLATLTTSRAELVTVICETPRGMRIDYGGEGFNGDKGDPKLEVGEDAFQGVTPIFIWDSSEFKSMTVIFGSTVPSGMSREQVEKLSPTEAEKAEIVHVSENQITAIYSYSNGAWVYSLYPGLGIGIYTRQTHWTGGNHATGSVMQSKCKFN